MRDVKLPTPLFFALAAGCSAEFDSERIKLFDSGFRTVAIDEVQPDEVSTEGGFPVCIEGRGLDADEVASVEVGGVECLSTSGLDEGRRLGCQVPPGVAGETELVVTKIDASTDSAPITYVQIDHEIVEVGCCGIRHSTQFEAGDGGELTHVAPPVKVYVADAEAASYQVFLGVGTFNTDARDSCWTWTPAQAAGMDGEETLWTGEFNVPTEPRTYSYIYRVSADDGRTWAYCDMLGDDGSCMENTGGGQNDYVPTQAGAFYVQ